MVKIHICAQSMCGVHVCRGIEHMLSQGQRTATGTGVESSSTSVLCNRPGSSNSQSIPTQCKVKSFPCCMPHRVAPISIYITLGHRSAESSQGYSLGLVQWQLPMFTPLLLSFNVEWLTRRQQVPFFKSVWYDPAGIRTHNLPNMRQTLLTTRPLNKHNVCSLFIDFVFDQIKKVINVILIFCFSSGVVQV